MKLRLSILLLAAALAASPAAGQTIKSLGYNTTNGVVPTSLSTNTLRFTNAEGLQFNKLTTENMVLGTNGVMTFYSTNSGFGFSAGATAAQFCDDLGLGTTNAVTFGTLAAGQLQVTSGTNLYVNLADDVSEFFVPLQLEDQLTVVGAATFSTNVTVNGNATLNGVNNTAPSQTADSGSSLMTRDLGDNNYLGEFWNAWRMSSYNTATIPVGVFKSATCVLYTNGQSAFYVETFLDPSKYAGKTLQVVGYCRVDTTNGGVVNGLAKVSWVTNIVGGGADPNFPISTGGASHGSFGGSFTNFPIDASTNQYVVLNSPIGTVATNAKMILVSFGFNRASTNTTFTGNLYLHGVQVVVDP
jgi:hypothetical protein